MRGRCWVLGAAMLVGCSGGDPPVHFEFVSTSVSSASSTSSSGTGGAGGGGGASSTTSSSTTTTTAGAGGAGGGPIECIWDDDCGQASECASFNCNDNWLCDTLYAAEGTPVADQVPGDCKTKVCDGAGAIVEVVAADVPSDGEWCTQDSCDNGVPVHKPAADGLACSGVNPGLGLCLAGVCTPWAPVVCVTPGQTYTACDGVDHVWSMVFTSVSGSSTSCQLAADQGYCPPANACTVHLANGTHLYGQCQ